jgi:hypothetical protein
VSQRQLSPIVPLVFYTGEKRWETPIGLESLMDLPVGLQRFVPRWETLFPPLHTTPAEALTRFATAIGWALRVWQAEKTPSVELERVLSEAMTGLEGLSEEQAGQWARVAAFFVQLIFHRRDEGQLIELLLDRARQSKFREREEVVEVGLTLAQAAEARGAERNMREAVQTVLESRFGAIPADIQQAVAAADMESLGAWLRLAATAPTLEDVGILPKPPET